MILIILRYLLKTLFKGKCLGFLIIINFKDKVSAIKIDTEGHEYNVLLGAQKIIQNHNPEIIFEINKTSFDACLSLLNNFGYKVYFIDDLNCRFIEINKYDENLIKKEGSNCYATQNYHYLNFDVK